MRDGPGQPPRYETAADLELKVEEYFSSLIDDEIALGKTKVPTMAGLAFFLGFKTRQSMYDMEKRGKDFAFVVQRARLAIEAGVEQLLIREGKAGQIFWLKNHSDYVDRVETDNTHHGGVSFQVKNA